MKLFVTKQHLRGDSLKSDCDSDRSSDVCDGVCSADELKGLRTSTQPAEHEWVEVAPGVNFKRSDPE
jgi:hypothetical protein